MAAAALLRIADDEYAAVEPGPSGAVRLVSAGYLPLRVRVAAAGVHHRPAFPGTTVVIGEDRYEVIDERVEGTAVVYTLRPWPPDHIVREQVVYGPALIEAVREERRRLAQRERGRRRMWPLYPLVGALPEPSQIRWCDRWGLDPLLATRVSGLTEAAVVCVLWASLPPGLLISLMAPAGLVVLTGMLRALGSGLGDEVAGSAVVAPLCRLAERIRGAAAYDPTLLPMTRQAFWARLALPDRQTREPDGSLTVRSVLPHLIWTPGARLLGEEDHWWRVRSASAAVERGRVVYTYALEVETRGDRALADVPPPRVDAYQQTVLEDVWREWEDLRSAGFGVLVAMLPVEVQQRAVGSVGGPPALRRAAVAGALLVTAAAAWMALVPSVLNVVTAALLAADSVFRLRRVGEGRYAPSVLARGLARYLRPERVSYHAHRDAEWRVVRPDASA